MSFSKFSMIVAHDRSRRIGFENRLPWKLPTDMRHFRTVTAGKAVLMGRKTAESIGRALPGRLNLVMTRSNFAPYPEQEPVRSLEQARQLAGLEDIVCIGGGEIYSLMLPFADRLYVTEVDTVLPQYDASFPLVNPAQWLRTEVSEWVQEEKDEFAMRMLEYRRI